MTDSTAELLDTLAAMLLRCWLFGVALLLIWLGAVLLARDVIHALHGPMFGLSSYELDLIFYGGMDLLKLGVLVGFFIPWLARGPR